MTKSDIVIGGIYFVKEDKNSIIQIQKELDMNGNVEGLLYKCNEEPTLKEFNVSKISPIPITKSLLHLLSFKEVNGNLEGLIDEHFFELKSQDIHIRIVKEKGDFCYVKKMAHSDYGCKFIRIPFLHQLQGLLASLKLPIIQIVIRYAFSTK